MNTTAHVPHVVVGYDGSPDSLAALTWAADMASRRGEAVVVTTIVDPRETPRGVAWPPSYWDDLETKAREALGTWPDVPVTFERHGGHLVPRLAEAARDATLLVVGSHGHTRVGEMVLGSVSQAAARHASVPVVVVRPAQNPDAGRIVVGADGSEGSDRALDAACRMAETTGDKLVVLRAWNPVPLVADRFGYMPPPSHETIDYAESALGRTVDRLREEHADLDIEGELFRGAAEKGLVDASANASMVVVGSRGQTAVAEVLMGSVSNAVLHKATCPVVVAH